jgi:uncharacterized protein (DUF1810 family)
VDDPYELERFEKAQAERDTYDKAVSELRAGRKRSHWMWFIFPQLAGLGASRTSEFYAISSLAEAQAYLAHPLLGPRLLECAQILTEIGESDPQRVFGEVDAMKLRSSITLFESAAPDTPVFQDVLDRYFGGQADDRTKQLLKRSAG